MTKKSHPKGRRAQPTPPFFILGLFAFFAWPTKPSQHDHAIDHSQETHA